MNISAFATDIQPIGSKIEDRVLYFDFSKEYRELERRKRSYFRELLLY